MPNNLKQCVALGFIGEDSTGEMPPHYKTKRLSNAASYTSLSNTECWPIEIRVTPRAKAGKYLLTVSEEEISLIEVTATKDKSE